MDSLERLLDSILMVERRRIDGTLVTPLNVESFNDEYVSDQVERLPVRREKFESAKAVLHSAGLKGGVDREEYATHAFTLNSLARQITNLYASTFDEDGADRLNAQAGLKVQRTYPVDGAYTTTPESNIFSLDNKGFCDEGTLFKQVFDGKSGFLDQVRLYNQVHRNTLVVGSALWSEMESELKSLVKNYSEQLDTVEMGVGRDEYLARIEEFNSEFGNEVSFVVDDDNVLSARFETSPVRMVSVSTSYLDGLSLLWLNGHPVLSASDKSYLDIFSQEEFDRPTGVTLDSDQALCYIPVENDPLLAKRVIQAYMKHDDLK